MAAFTSEGLLRLRGHLRKHRVAVVNAHFPGLVALQFVLVKQILQRDLCVILSFHGLDIVAASKTEGFERWLWKYLLRSADALVGCSEHLAEQLRAFEPRAGSRTACIHNGLEIEGFMAERDPHLVPDPGLNGRQIILNVAAYEPKKGLDVLIRAFAIIGHKQQGARTNAGTGHALTIVPRRAANSAPLVEIWRPLL